MPPMKRSTHTALRVTQRLAWTALLALALAGCSRGGGSSSDDATSASTTPPLPEGETEPSPSSAEPVKVAPPAWQDEGLPGADVARVVDVEAGEELTCVRDSAGAVRCWGRNDDNELGSRRLGTGSLLPVDVKLPPVDTLTIVSLPAPPDEASEPRLQGLERPFGMRNALCATPRDGGIHCVGLGAREVIRIPLLAATTRDDRVGCGQRFCCAVQPDATVLCEDLDKRLWTVDGAASTTALATSLDGLCVIDGTGRVACGPPQGPLAADARWPQPVSRLALGPGGAACAVDTLGVVQCFCPAAAPQGEAICGGADRQVVFALPAPVLDIAVGVDHACALLEDGRVTCWGDNRRGQLGDGTYDAAVARPVLARFVYDSPGESFVAPSLVPQGAPPWPEDLPADCAATPSPAGGITFPVHAARVREVVDDGSLRYHLQLANFDAPLGAEALLLRGDQRVVELTLGELSAPNAGSLPLRPGRYKGESADRGLRAAMREPAWSERMAGVVDLTYVGEELVCGLVELELADDERLRARFAARVEPGTQLRASPPRPVPAPQPVALGAGTVSAEVCAVEGILLDGERPPAGLAATAERLYLDTFAGELVALRVGSEVPCTLSLDPTLGEHGRLARGSGPWSLTADTQGRLLVSGATRSERFDPATGQSWSCPSNAALAMAPSGTWGAGLDRQRNVVRARFDDESSSCTSEPLAWRSPLEQTYAVNVLDESTLAVLGAREGQGAVALVAASGGEPLAVLALAERAAPGHARRCPAGLCVTSGRELVIVGDDGQEVGRVDLAKLLGVADPVVRGFDVAPDGVLWLTVSRSRGAGLVEDVFVFRVRLPGRGE